MEVPIIGIVVTLIFSAFFSGLEIAYISSNRLKIELDKSKGTFNARLLASFYKNESFFIAMLLLGNNISLVFFGLFSAILLDPIIVSWGITSEALILLIQTLLSTALVLITAEFLPKAFVQINPNGYLKYSAYPMMIIFGILYLPTHVILMISNVALRLLKVDNEKSEKVFSKVDLEHYKVEVATLQHQLRRTSEQVLSYERIHHDLEERLEKVTKDKINLGKQFSKSNRESLKQLAKAVEEKDDWEKRYNEQSIRCQALSETIRNLEKELYMMHLRKYEFMKTSEESTRRSGGLPFPINVSSLSFDKNSSAISDDERLKLAQEQEAARIVANCSPSSEDPNPVHALARELALQRGKGQLIKNLSIFFGCV